MLLCAQITEARFVDHFVDIAKVTFDIAELLSDDFANFWFRWPLHFCNLQKLLSRLLAIGPRFFANGYEWRVQNIDHFFGLMARFVEQF